MSLYLGSNLVSGVATPIEGARNIGQIIQSTIPLTDAGLHLLDGSLIFGSGSYSAFVTYIAGLISNYPDLFTTEANWQTAVSTYGVCGKFVYDSVNNTVRLPKIAGFTEGTIDPTVLGDLAQAGLPNITGSTASLVNSADRTSGALSNTSYISGNGVSPSSSGTSKIRYIDIDASRSSSIYGNSTTVQPQSIKVLYYIVIATSVKTQIEVDIDEVMTDLNGKADTDLLNASSALVDLLYPVGSVYIGTGATCPLASIKGTWTLISSGIMQSSNTIPVKGNGNSLGFTNGSTNFGLSTYNGSVSGYTGGFNVSVGTATGSATVSGTGRPAAGITTDSTKSGLVGDTSSLTLSVNIWERTA